MTDERLKEAREYAVQQNINILRNRVNQLGVAEPLVQRQGADRIVVELPGIEGYRACEGNPWRDRDPRVPSGQY